MRNKSLITASLFIAVLAIAACAGSERRVKFDNSLSQKLGEEPIALNGTLIKPAGDGPFPAVVILHPCSGPMPNQVRWALRFTSWGYVSFLVNSFEHRGVSSDCTEPHKVSFEMRARDAYDAKSYLATQSFIDPDRIAVVGWCHGASGTIEATTLEFNYPRERLFSAAVAFYPYCKQGLGAVNAPLLILTGELDDWYPAQNCVDNVPEKTKTGHEVVLKVYAEANHFFDVTGLNMTSYDHRLKYNQSAAANAEVQVKDFLAKYLQ